MSNYQTAIETEYANNSEGNNAKDLLLAIDTEFQKWETLKRQLSDANLQEDISSAAIKKGRGIATSPDGHSDQNETFKIDNQISSFIDLVLHSGDLDLITQKLIELSSSVEAAMARGLMKSKKQQELLEKLFNIIKTLQDKIENATAAQNIALTQKNIQAINANLVAQAARLSNELQLFTSRLLQTIKKSLEQSMKQPQTAANLQLQQALQNLQQLMLKTIADMQRLSKSLDGLIRETYNNAKTQTPPNDLLLKTLRDLGRLNAENARRLADLTSQLSKNRLTPDEILKITAELNSRLQNTEQQMRMMREALMRQQSLITNRPDANNLSLISERMRAMENTMRDAMSRLNMNQTRDMLSKTQPANQMAREAGQVRTVTENIKNTEIANRVTDQLQSQTRPRAANTAFEHAALNTQIAANNIASANNPITTNSPAITSPATNHPSIQSGQISSSFSTSGPNLASGPVSAPPTITPSYSAPNAQPAPAPFNPIDRGIPVSQPVAPTQPSSPTITPAPTTQAQPGTAAQPEPAAAQTAPETTQPGITPVEPTLETPSLQTAGPCTCTGGPCCGNGAAAMNVDTSSAPPSNDIAATQASAASSLNNAVDSITF